MSLAAGAHNAGHSAPGNVKMPGSIGGNKNASLALETRATNNPVPKTIARVVPNIDGIKDLGVPGAKRVFVTADSDIKGMDANQIQTKLAIDLSPTGYQVFKFPTPDGIATPIYHSDPRFVGNGTTLDGAREFTIPNQPVPTNSIIRKAQP